MEAAKNELNIVNQSISTLIATNQQSRSTIMATVTEEKALFEALSTIKTPYLSTMAGLTTDLSAKQAALAKIPKVVAPKAWPFK